MGLRINTNLPALVAQRHLRNTRTNLDQTLERLSSGYRINHAGDDAAGLAISETLRSELRGIAQAERNAQDGISVVQIAEGSMSEVSNILIRMRELAVQAASDTLGVQERKFLQKEFEQLQEEVDRIALGTKYNGVPLLNGASETFEIQVGTGNNPITDRIKLFDPYSADINVVALGINLSSVGDKTSAQNSLGTLDKAIQSVTAIRAQFGAMQNRLQSVINNQAIAKENMAAANSRIRDADMAVETSEMTKNNILVQSGVAVLANANSTNRTALNLLGQGGAG